MAFKALHVSLLPKHHREARKDNFHETLPIANPTAKVHA